MPSIPPRKRRSCVEILDDLGDDPKWDDYLASLAAAAEEEGERDAEAAPGDRPARQALEASEIADLRRRLGLG